MSCETFWIEIGIKYALSLFQLEMAEASAIKLAMLDGILGTNVAVSNAHIILTLKLRGPRPCKILYATWFKREKVSLQYPVKGKWPSFRKHVYNLSHQKYL